MLHHVAGKPRKLGGWRKADRASGPEMPLHAADLPVSVDLSPLMPPVNDQGGIGSCVANSSLEGLEMLQRKGAGDAPLSRLYLYYWARIHEGVSPDDDSGLMIPDAIDVLTKRGACLESSWDYSEPERRFKLQPPADLDAEAAKNRIVLSFDCPNLFTIRASLAQGFPLAFGLPLPQAFMSGETARTGLVPFTTDTSAGGHSMLICGFQDDKVLAPGDVGALRVRNSWSRYWGVGGDCWLSYRYVTEGIASDFTSIRRATI